jgi:hypothetical protein
MRKSRTTPRRLIWPRAGTKLDLAPLDGPHPELLPLGTPLCELQPVGTDFGLKSWPRARRRRKKSNSE